MSSLSADKQRLQQLMQQGRLEDAGALAAQLCTRAPQDIDVWIGRGLVHGVRQELAEAEACFRTALAINPAEARALLQIGKVCEARGQAAEAQRYYRETLKVAPHHAEALCALGYLQQRINQLTDAIASFRRAVAARADYPEAHYGLGAALWQSGDVQAAVSAFQQALWLDPRHVRALFSLGNIYKLQGQNDEAIACYERVIALAPAHVGAHMNLAIAYKDCGRNDEALANLDRVVTLQPTYAEAHTARGDVLRELGRLDEAPVAYREALRLKPDYGEAYRALVRHRRYTERDADVAAMERLWSTSDLDPGVRMHLGFALGKVSEDLGEYDAAFRYFSEGNRLKRASFEYDVRNTASDFQRLMAVFDQDFFRGRDTWGDPDQTPIVIVGMPRSGTSLTEQILASHPQVAAAGELLDLRQVVWGTLPALTVDNFPEAVCTLDRAAFAQLGAAYASRLRRHGGHAAAHITDKLPANFTFVGMLHAMLPRARVIHCRRNALDTCWSIYKHYFVGEQPFAYDLRELGRYYQLYEALMAHWARVLPGDMLEFDYESVVADQEGATRRLLEFCGLEWDARCLQFHETDRVVKTASLAQVRRPLYKGAIGVWRRYEEHLGPLVEILGRRDA